MFLLFWVWGGINGGRFAPYPQKNLEEGPKRGRTGRGGSGSRVWKKRQKIRSRGLSLHPHPIKKNRFPNWQGRGKMYILSKHSKCVIKFITFVYELGTRDSQ